MTAAGDEAAQLGRDQFDWYKNEYERTRPQREATAALDARIADQQYQGMQYAMEQARELDQRRRGTFQPLEDKLIAEANAFDTDAKREELAGEAMADVNQAFSSARGQQTRALARQGVDPGSGRALAIGQQGATAQALELARAGTQTRKQARAEGQALKMDAIGLGKGVIGNQATMQQIAQQGGNAAVNAGSAGVNVNNSGAGLMQAGFGSAMQGYGTMQDLFGQGGKFQSTANDWTSKRNDAYGGMLGGMMDLGKKGYEVYQSLGNAVSGTSDKTKKKNTGKPADGDEALEQLDAIPIHKDWEYDEAKGAPPGSGGVPHTGPMAQDVQAAMGDKTAPGGKVIDLIDMNGKLMAGMQALNKRMKKLEGAAA